MPAAHILNETAMAHHNNRFRDLHTPPNDWGFADGPLLGRECSDAPARNATAEHTCSQCHVIVWSGHTQLRA